MRIWQARSVAWIVSLGGALSMRTVKASIGEAACGTTAAPSTAKVSSGIGGLAPELGVELVHAFPDRGAAAEATPVRADDADDAITDVDRGDVLVHGSAFLPRHARVVDEESLDIGAHALDGGALRAHPGPRRAIGWKFDG